MLIVNDDISVADAFARALRLQGFEVWSGLSQDEGVALASRHVPHAIVLDLRMPLSSSLSLLHRLRALPGLADTPVAIVSGDYHADRGITDEAAVLGADVRFKPVWLDELVDLARGLLAVPVP